MRKDRPKRMAAKRFAPVIALLLAVITPHTAYACQYTQAPEQVGQTSGEYFAKVMTGAASSVDLVLVEDDGTRPQNQPDTGIITVRVIARFKGGSADRFSLFGTGLTLRPEAESVFKSPLQHFTSDTGQVTPFAYNEERQGLLLPPVALGQPVPPPVTSCSPPPLQAETGRFYIAMRGADGRLLNSVAIEDGRFPAFGFVPVRLETDDFWLGAVGRATFDATAPVTPRAVLNVRPGSDPARIEASLRKSGARIRAAYFRDAGLIDEVRPSDAETSAPWLASTGALVGRRGKAGIGDPNHSAAEYVRAKLGPLQRFSGSLAYELAQAFTASVRRTQQRTGTSSMIALEIEGDPEAFASESFYAGSIQLSPGALGLAPIEGGDEAAQFATLQRIERDIWFLNGGNGNRQGTLP